MNKKQPFILLFLYFVSCFLYIGQAFAGGIVEFSQKDGKEIIEITAPDNKKRKVFTVPNPDRLVVDVPSMVGKPKANVPDDYDGKLIKSVRVGQFNPKTLRFVFELNQTVKVVAVDADGAKLLVTIEGRGAEQVASAQPSPPPKEIEKTEKPVKQEKQKPIIYSSKKYKRDSLPMIVIDAGHGGVDPGAIGENGTREKDLVLEYAKVLRSELLRTKRYRVKLTRSTDSFIRLRQRVEIARKADAALFISLHADSAEELEARGVSVYTVSEQASDKEAEALAARENKSDIIAGMDLSDERADVADILISLAQRETKNNSALLADYLVMSLGDKVRLLPNTHRFAGFAVLKAPDIPSVLIEIGFLSHPSEERELRSKYYRNKIIEGIIGGIDTYFRKKYSLGIDNL